MSQKETPRLYVDAEDDRFPLLHDVLIRAARLPGSKLEVMPSTKNLFLCTKLTSKNLVLDPSRGCMLVCNCPPMRRRLERSKQTTYTSRPPAKAIQDIKVDHKTIEDIKVKHEAPENIEAADGSAESSVKHEKDPTNEKHPTSDKDSSDDASSDDESSGSSTVSLPEYIKWSSDWRDIYAEVLMLAEEHSTNPKKREIMSDLLAAACNAQSLLDKSSE